MSFGRCVAGTALHPPATAVHTASCNRHAHVIPSSAVPFTPHARQLLSHVRKLVVVAAGQYNKKSNRNVPNSKDGWLELIRDSVEPQLAPPDEDDAPQKKKQRKGMTAAPRQREPNTRQNSAPNSRRNGTTQQPVSRKESNDDAPKDLTMTAPLVAVTGAMAVTGAVAAAEADGTSTYESSDMPPGNVSDGSAVSETADEAEAEYEEDEFEDWEEIRENRKLPNGRWDWELPETHPMYQPILTDEMLAEDPPGHRSGYLSVVGYPNAGKSTLINALVGQKLSIVSYKPQTTRHRIMGIASGPDHQMIIYDTPGIVQQQRTKLEERMMAAVVASIKDSEAILAVVDASHNAKEALGLIQPGPDWNGPPMAVVLNKADLVAPARLDELADWYRTNCRAEAVFNISALQGEGVDAVRAWAVSKMPEGPTLFPKDMASQQPERFFVTEIVREKIFVLYQHEIPYSCQVEINEFKERPGAKDFISCNILVERESQAPILIGKGGAALRVLGQEARKDMEDFLGRPVFLELSVKVAKDWRDKEAALKSFGYYDQFGW